MELEDNFDYTKVPNLAAEAQEKLQKFQPRSIHQARQISGINPSDLMVLIQ